MILYDLFIHTNLKNNIQIDSVLINKLLHIIFYLLLQHINHIQINLIFHIYLLHLNCRIL